MQERIDLVVVAEEKRRPAGLSASVIVSLIAHAALMVWFITSYKPTAAPRQVPIARYVDLMRQQPQERDHVEAPGPAVARTPLSAPLSDKNREASMPEPTGPNPTTRPGDGSNSAYTPPRDSRPRGSEESAPAMPTPQLGLPAPKAPLPDSTFVYNEPARAAMAGPVVDLRKALREASRSLAGAPGGGDGGEVAAIGGEQGTAEQGPLSFETQWYDWGDYAQSMVSKIRVNWYANMPQIIRTGMKGVVTIRFTIHRDGRISDITILKSSGVPPYDAAARRAIELSSPLKALPADFPNATERVTCMFYYNMEIPQRS